MTSKQEWLTKSRAPKALSRPTTASARQARAPLESPGRKEIQANDRW